MIQMWSVGEDVLMLILSSSLSQTIKGDTLDEKAVVFKSFSDFFNKRMRRRFLCYMINQFKKFPFNDAY